MGGDPERCQTIVLPYLGILPLCHTLYPGSHSLYKRSLLLAHTTHQARQKAFDLLGLQHLAARRQQTQFLNTNGRRQMRMVRQDQLRYGALQCLILESGKRLSVPSHCLMVIKKRQGGRMHMWMIPGCCLTADIDIRQQKTYGP
jgi:hypothetical protein